MMCCSQSSGSGRRSIPISKVTSSNHTYFNDMGMPKLLKSVEKLDDYTVRFTLNRPEAPFLSDLAMEYAAIQSKEYADAMLKAGTPEKLDQEPVGTGPFFLVQYQKDAVVRYRAFPEFWAGRAKIDDLVFSITPDASVRLAKVQKGECHVMPYPNPADLDAIRKDANVQLLEQPGLTSGISPTTPRRRHSTMSGSARPSTWRSTRRRSSTRFISRRELSPKNPIPPSMWSYNDDVRDDPYDPDGAKKLLTEAGLGNGFETDVWAMPVQRAYNPNARRIAELIQADLARIGIKAEIKTYEWGEYRKRLQAGEHQTGMLGWVGDNGDPDNFLHTLLGCDAAQPGGGNVAKWCDRGFDDLVTKAKVTTDQKQRTELYQRAQVIFKEQAPWLTIAHAVQLKPVRKEVIDFKLSPFGRHSFYGVDLKD